MVVCIRAADDARREAAFGKVYPVLFRVGMGARLNESSDYIDAKRRASEVAGSTVTRVGGSMTPPGFAPVGHVLKNAVHSGTFFVGDLAPISSTEPFH
jgi:hypothetical protein